MAKFPSIFLGIWLGGAGCWAVNKYIAGHDCSELIRFFRNSVDDQFAEFARLDTEPKYVIYLCGNQFMHPPAQYLAAPFARDTQNVVEFLRDRLSQAPDDLTVRDIVLVFKEMRRQETYDVARDKALIALMNDRVDRMKNDDWKRVTKQMLNRIVE